jgi:AcrR family transcriptional regulator
MRTSKETTRQVLIDAATQVFASEGFKGATTRQMAQCANVNECTLFRHFPTKDDLLEAAVENIANKISDALKILLDIDHDDMASVLTHFARHYSDVLEENELFIRTFIGEGKRQPEKTSRIFLAAIQPIKDQLVQYFEVLQQKGKLRSDLHMAAVIDSFICMLLGGMIQRTTVPIPYDRDLYLSHCVEIFLQGVKTYDE